MRTWWSPKKKSYRPLVGRKLRLQSIVSQSAPYGAPGLRELFVLGFRMSQSSNNSVFSQIFGHENDVKRAFDSLCRRIIRPTRER